MATRLAVWLVMVAAVSLAACRSEKVAESGGSPPAPTIEIGQVSELPADGQASAGVSLVVPEGLLRIPGSYPLGSVVGFQVPIRNEGPEPIEIRRLEPG